MGTVHVNSVLRLDLLSKYQSPTSIFLSAVQSLSSLIGGAVQSRSAGVVMTNEMGRKSGT